MFPMLLLVRRLISAQVLDQGDLKIVLPPFICIITIRPQCQQEVQQLLQSPSLSYRAVGSKAENRGQREPFRK